MMETQCEMTGKVKQKQNIPSPSKEKDKLKQIKLIYTGTLWERGSTLQELK